MSRLRTARPHASAARGVTLMEVLVASSLALIAILGMTSVEVTRIGLSQQLPQNSLTNPPERFNASMGTRHLVRRLERADRVNLVAADHLQVRVPIGVNFDDPASYRWDEYRLLGDALTYLSDTAPPCPAGSESLARQITGFSAAFVDMAVAPPGGEGIATGEDTNVVAVSVSWDDSAGTTQMFSAEVSLRGGVYSNVGTSCGGGFPCDSGTGLETPGSSTSPPPPTCL